MSNKKLQEIIQSKKDFLNTVEILSQLGIPYNQALIDEAEEFILNAEADLVEITHNDKSN